MKKSNLFFCLVVLYGCSSNHNVYIGEQYLGARYINNPLGEEKLPDTDPLIRTDAFDCTTFIETSLANGDVNKLNKIRYKDGKIDFINRNHFMEYDWLQNNSDIVENVSNQYGKTAIRTILLDKQNWFKKKHNIDVNIPKQTVKLEYIPYSNLGNIKTDETLIVFFVIDSAKIREKIGTDIGVVHVGFLLPNGMLRHASRKYKRVMDVDFEKYINKIKQNKNSIGIALVKIK